MEYTRPPLEMNMMLSRNAMIFTIKIYDRALAGRTLGAIGAVGVVGGLAYFYRANREQVNNAIAQALEVFGRALNFREGSIVFEFVCDGPLFSRMPWEAFISAVDQRVRYAFCGIGFPPEQLEVTGTWATPDGKGCIRNLRYQGSLEVMMGGHCGTYWGTPFQPGWPCANNFSGVNYPGFYTPGGGLVAY